jgi:hypothetical protein
MSTFALRIPLDPPRKKPRAVWKRPDFQLPGQTPGGPGPAPVIPPTEEELRFLAILREADRLGHQAAQAAEPTWGAIACGVRGPNEGISCRLDYDTGKVWIDLVAPPGTEAEAFLQWLLDSRKAGLPWITPSLRVPEPFEAYKERTMVKISGVRLRIGRYDRMIAKRDAFAKAAIASLTVAIPGLTATMGTR